MKKTLIAFGLLALAAGVAWAQALLPIPSGMCTAGQVMYAIDANSAACTSAGSCLGMSPRQ